MKNIKNLFKENYLAFLLFLIALLVNQYSGNRGVFPIDSFSHFDSGFRILKGDHPFKDYWVVSGPIVDYLQSIFFFFFGINWQSYVFHASFINGIFDPDNIKLDEPNHSVIKMAQLFNHDGFNIVIFSINCKIN